jgi:hypothetical protein
MAGANCGRWRYETERHWTVTESRYQPERELSRP